MSNSTLKNFYEDGPFIFTEAQFKEFKDHVDTKAPSFDNQVLTWINPKYEQYIRRLCLRNVLRQDGKRDTNPVLPRYNYLCYSISRFLSCLRNEYDFKTLLSLRPDLLEEFTQEFLYSLKHGIQHQVDSWGRSSIDTMIEIAISVVDDNLGRQLWNYHYAANHIHPDNIATVLNLYNREDLPEWVKNRILNTTKRLISREIGEYSVEFKKAGIVGFVYLSGSELQHKPERQSIISAIIDWLTIEIVRSNHHSTGTTLPDFPTKIVILMEQIVPLELIWISSNHLEELIFAVSENLAYQIAHRFIMALSTQERVEFKYDLDNVRIRKVAFYYVYALAITHHPDDKHFIERLSYCLGL